MKIYAQILGTCTGDSTPSVLIFFDQKRYLFNCGEGTQRFCTEHKVKLSRIRDVFLTRLNWENTGGLPGALLTVADTLKAVGPGEHGLAIHGPRYTRNFIAALRYFIIRRNLIFNVEEFVADETGSVPAAFNDGCLEVIPIELVLPEESPLAPCLSLTESETTERPLVLVGVEGGEGEKEKEKEDEGKGKEKETTPLSPMVVDSTVVDDSEVADAVMRDTTTPTTTTTTTTTGGKRKGVENDSQHVGEEESDDESATCRLHEGDSESHMEVDQQHPQQHQHYRRGSIVLDAKASDSTNKINRSSLITLLSSYSHRRPKRMRVEPDASSSSSDEETNHHALPPLPRLVGPKSAHPTTAVLCYICRSPDLPGKFDAKKAIELGVPKGPLYGRLCKGETIVTPEGREVKPSDCIGPKRPGTVFAIVHCPSAEYVPILMNHPAWKDYLAINNKGEEEKKVVSCMLHITPAEVLESNDGYKEWMHSFGTTTQHIIVNEKHCSKRLVFLAAASNQYRLHSVREEVFALPHFSNDVAPIPDGMPKKTVAAEPMLKFWLAPPESVALDDSEVVAPAIDTNKLDNEMAQNEEFQAALGEVRQWRQEHDHRFTPACGGEDDFQLNFLGTGAALPSKYRNVTSIYVATPKHGGFFLDCGEGSLGQLTRRFGHEEAKNILINLRCVFISHMHADHHLGLVRVLSERQRLLNAIGQDTSLLVIGPMALYHWLTEYSEIQDLKFNFLSCKELSPKASKRTEASLSWSGFFTEQMGMAEVVAVEVDHCPYAYGFALKHISGWKLVFSGDTRPCRKLNAVGEGASVLIHEATFENDMAQEAIEKNHSTTTEAIASAIEMNAKFVILFHFSQRYPKIPVFDDTFKDRTGISFDLMSVWLHQLAMLPPLSPALKCIFKDLEKEEAKGEGQEEEEGEDEEGEKEKKKEKPVAAKGKGKGKGKQQPQQQQQKKQQQQQKRKKDK